MTGTVHANGKRRSRSANLTKRFKEEKFRKTYFARQLKVFLAAQIRALRGDRTQAQFGELIGKPQSVVARLERESYGKVNLQTLIDIATNLDIALVIRFVSFSTFLEWTKDYSASALAPTPFADTEHQTQPDLINALRGVRLAANTAAPDLSHATVNVPTQRVAEDIQEQLRKTPYLALSRQQQPILKSLTCV